MGTLELLRAADIGAGDKVIVPAFGNVEATEAVTLAGALPVFADIDPATYCIDPAAVAAAVDPRTAGMIAVHRFGRTADLKRLHAIGEKHGLLVLEQTEPDAAFDGIATRRAPRAAERTPHRSTHPRALPSTHIRAVRRARARERTSRP